jgi:hypothetical protein
LDCGTFVAASSSFADSRKKRGSTSLSGIADISRLLMSVIVHEMIAIMGPRQRDPASRQKRITLTLDLATRLSWRGQLRLPCAPMHKSQCQTIIEKECALTLSIWRRWKSQKQTQKVLKLNNSAITFPTMTHVGWVVADPSRAKGPKLHYCHCEIYQQRLCIKPSSYSKILLLSQPWRRLRETQKYRRGMLRRKRQTKDVTALDDEEEGGRRLSWMWEKPATRGRYFGFRDRSIRSDLRHSADGSGEYKPTGNRWWRKDFLSI